MAAGDLNVVSQGTFGGVIGEFQSALAQLNVNLRAVVADARSEALAVESQVEEIAAGNRDMSVRTEAQAANLEQTAASVEQITATVRNNTQAAKDAVRSAESTTAVARQAHESVLSVAATIKDISTASQRIADITQVIDGISFQTNILALNAAVEAARAGESGRGFSVVAAEVRSLAQRTTEAAQEIKTLVESAHGIVDSGVQLATQAARAMNEAEAQVAETTRLIGQIELASAEQLLGVDQVNAAVTQLDGVTQRNAEMVHDLAHAAARLIERAKILTEAVQVFRVDQAPVDIPDAVELRREARRKKAEEVLASYAEASDTEA
jgi:aerotaxis receptor